MRTVWMRLGACLVMVTAALGMPSRGLAQTPPPPSVDGHWTGTIEIPATPLAIDVDLAEENGTWRGDITIPAQGATDLPLTGVAVSGSEVRFAIGGVPGEPTFAGQLGDDGLDIAGTFTQGGGSFPFRLSKSKPGAAAADRLAGIDVFIESALTAWDVPGIAVGVVAGGEVVLARGFGHRDVAGKLPMTADTLLPIGSATKAFTTFVLGTLVDEGKLAWDEPVRRHLPGFELHDDYASQHVNAVDLVTHRSGLPRHDLVWYNNQELTRQQLVERLRHLPASKQLREQFQYNNLMYLAAGRLIEVLTGGSWEDAVRARILGPLGMTSTLFSDAEAQTRPDYAKPYRFTDDVLKEIAFREVGNMGPAGSISSSVNDMCRWLRLHLQGGRHDGRALIEPATLLQLHTPQMALAARPEKPQFSTEAYAMGWSVDAYRGHNRISHGGAIDGFVALVTLLPDDGAGVVVLANAETGLTGVLTQHLMDRLLDLEPIDWNAEGIALLTRGRQAGREAETRKGAAQVADTRPVHPLAAYAGDYAHPGYGTLHVELAGKALRATYNFIVTPLAHWHYETFAGGKGDDPTFEDMKYTFVTDAQGNVAALRAPFEPAVDELVFARQPDARLRDPEHLRTLAGTYDLAGLLLTVGTRGDELTLLVPGQPLYTLEPDLGGWFAIQGISGYRVRFTADGLELQQPDGLYTARRTGRS
jgi:CubicO group peptidase (beta-lactamase class C family)